MASSVRFILIFSSIAGLLLAVKSGYAYSTLDENKDFEIHTSNVIDEDIRGNVVSSVEDTPHGEIAAEMIDSVPLNLGTSATTCDLFAGTWVRDDSYPLFQAGQCPYDDGKFDCKGNGRPDSDYLKWRWQPSGCEIPSFNAENLLERLRGKRLMFVGDSISQNQWESMVCMLQAVIPSNKKNVTQNSSRTIFNALDYDASVEFFMSTFLVDLHNNSQNQRILYLDTLQDNGVYWKGVDILVFETSHWWQGERWDLIMANNQLYTNMDPLVAYKRALTTWANWIPANIDPKKSLVFFSTSSPKHFNSTYWNQMNGQRCYGQTEPVEFAGYSPPAIPQVPIVKEVIGSMSFPVTLLDITGLSQFRKDGHPSIYSSLVTGDEKQDPGDYADCSHWCLPGVPDTWNELLYVTLLSKGLGN
eukprot:PITA_15374